MERTYSKPRSQLDYERDEWEKSPKTDYTYAKSASYNRNYNEHYIHPNMSRPSLRGDRSDESSLLNQSDCTDMSESSVKYHLRNRNVLDSPLPPSSSHRRTTTSWTEVVSERVDMVDKQSSPLVSGRTTITHIYGMDDVSPRKHLKEKRNVLATALSIIWATIIFPLKMIGLIADSQQTKRNRQSPNSSSHHGNESGGLFQAIRSIFLHLFAACAEASASVDTKLLNKTNKTRSCHFCCIPLILVALVALLGGGYLYACGNYPTSAQIYKYGDVAKNSIAEYALQSLEYVNEAYSYLWSCIVEPFKQYNTIAADSSHPLPEDQSQSSTKEADQSQPSMEKADQSGQEEQSETTPTEANCPLKDLDEKVAELRKSLEGAIGEKWKLYEAQSLKFDLEKLTKELDNKIKEVKDSVSSESVKRMHFESDQTAKQNLIQRLQVNLQESFDMFKVEVMNKVEEGQKGQLEVINSVRIEGEEAKRTIELHLHKIFSEPHDSKLNNLLLWLSEKFMSKEEMERRIDSTMEKVMMEVQQGVEEENKKLREEMKTLMKEIKIELNRKVEVASEMTSVTDGSITHEEVRMAIKQALSKYDSDKTGKTDFALESAGGSVLGVRCSKTYKKGMAQISLFGIPLWYVNNSPRTVIQPGSLPGECWPFDGSIGHVVIQLATRIHITEVSLEHVNVNITIFGNVESAPNEFAIWGLDDAYDQSGISLGNFTYDARKESIQYFPVDPKFHHLSFLHVELRVLSNHGNKEYTCLYRFRVHGKPARDPADHDNDH